MIFNKNIHGDRGKKNSKFKLKKKLEFLYQITIICSFLCINQANLTPKKIIECIGHISPSA